MKKLKFTTTFVLAFVGLMFIGSSSMSAAYDATAITGSGDNYISTEYDQYVYSGAPVINNSDNGSWITTINNYDENGYGTYYPGEVHYSKVTITNNTLNLDPSDPLYNGALYQQNFVYKLPVGSTLIDYNASYIGADVTSSFVYDSATNGIYSSSSGGFSVDPGETVELNIAYTVNSTVDAYTNTSTKPNMRAGAIVSMTKDFYYPPATPEITLDKNAVLNDTNGDGYLNSGESVDYTVNIANNSDGNVLDYQMTDTLLANASTITGLTISTPTITESNDYVSPFEVRDADGNIISEGTPTYDATTGTFTFPVIEAGASVTNNATPRSEAGDSYSITYTATIDDSFDMSQTNLVNVVYDASTTPPTACADEFGTSTTVSSGGTCTSTPTNPLVPVTPTTPSTPEPTVTTPETTSTGTQTITDTGITHLIVILGAMAALGSIYGVLRFKIK